MDPFSGEGELLNITNAFHQGQFDQVINYDTSSLSSSNTLAARILVLRARIATGDATTVLKELNGAKEPELQAVRALAEWKAGKQEEALAKVEDLTEKQGDNAVVQVLGGIVLQAAGKSEEALALVGKHQGSLEAVALIVYIHLQQNRTDLALKEVQAAKRWAQDNLLFNLAESWVGLRVGGEKYQAAFYVYEELASVQSTSAPKSLISQAVAEIHLGRLEEAEAALKQAVEKDPKDPDALVNSVVLDVIAGRDSTEAVKALKAVKPDHPFLVDSQEKSEAFGKAASKYSAKSAVAA